MNMCRQQCVSSRRRRRRTAPGAPAPSMTPIVSCECSVYDYNNQQREHSSTKASAQPKGLLDDIMRSEKRQDDIVAPGASSLDEESSSSESHSTDFSVPSEVPEAAPASLSSIDEIVPQLSSHCDACPHCADVCSDPFCRDCSSKKTAQHVVSSTCTNDDATPPTYTPCQVRRHNHASSAWLVCGTDIYDATAFLEGHPGGTTSILRRAGGVADCTEDMKMHSRDAVKMWKGSRIGTLCACPGKGSGGGATGNHKVDKKFECVIS